jgi:hypothetical protein
VGKEFRCFVDEEQQNKNRVNTDSKKKKTTKKALGTDVYHLGETLNQDVITLRYCSEHYLTDFMRKFVELAQFDSVRMSILRKPYKVDKRCDHQGERCKKIPVYRIEMTRTKFEEALML